MVMEWQDILFSITKGRQDSDTDFYFRGITPRNCENYHMNIHLDVFLDFYGKLIEKFPQSHPISCDEFVAGSRGKLVLIKAIQSTENPNLTGYVEFYNVTSADDN